MSELTLCFRRSKEAPAMVTVRRTELRVFIKYILRASAIFVISILVYFRIESVVSEPNDSTDAGKPRTLLTSVSNQPRQRSASVVIKAVPLHATEALRGRGDIAPTHSRPRH
jgi:hypothetical protein